MTRTLDTLLADIWEKLSASAGNPGAPWGLASLATVDEANQPRQRLVVLRGADPATRLILCYTDRRSAKIEQIQLQPRTAWLFYDRHQREQLVLYGEAHMRPRDDPMRQEALGQMSLEQLRNYGGRLAPGTPCDESYPGLPADAIREQRASVSPPGSEPFAVITAVIDGMDWLRLGAEGNHRARFWWTDPGWRGSWVAP